jgi:hypothetical protein
VSASPVRPRSGVATTGRRRHGSAWRRDPIGVALVAYGAAGLALLLATLLLILASLGTMEQLADSLRDDGPDSVPARLDSATAALQEAELAIAGFRSTLSATSGAAGSGEQLGRRLAGSLRQLALALDVPILGTRPFAALGAEFDAVAADADALAADLALTSAALDENREALDRLGAELARLRGELVAIRAGFAGPMPGLDGGGPGDAPARPEQLVPAAEAFTLSRLVLVALLVWLAVPAGIALVMGIRRLRRPPPATAA